MVKMPNKSNKNVLQGRPLLTLATCNSRSAMSFPTSEKKWYKNQGFIIFYGFSYGFGIFDKYGLISKNLDF